MRAKIINHRGGVGFGQPLREFMHVDDLANACLFYGKHNESGFLNVGTGVELTIADLASPGGPCNLLFRHRL